jgi:hypothetical protein
MVDHKSQSRQLKESLLTVEHRVFDDTLMQHLITVRSFEKSHLLYRHPKDMNNH